MSYFEGCRVGEWFLIWERISLFVLFMPSSDWMRPTDITECFIWPSDWLISSRNTLPETRRIMFDYISGHPMALSSWHTEFTITGYFCSKSIDFKLVLSFRKPPFFFELNLAYNPNMIMTMVIQINTTISSSNIFELLLHPGPVHSIWYTLTHWITIAILLNGYYYSTPISQR